ncbi:hypothetical protein ACFYOA_13230 [Streptomyces iakyrus]|uniref:hypothetical protein n=1 Tax=Streptomyces iakyrus TaxID=68219 RepID=UPI0036B396DB
MDKPTLWVLALFGFISLVCLMVAKLASEVEQAAAAWIGVYERLRERLRSRSRDDRSDDQDH